MAEAKNPIRRVESGANGTHVEVDLLWLRGQNRSQVRAAAVISVDDVDIIAAYRWIYSSGYATRTFQDGPEARRFQVTYGMHREIMGLPWQEDTLVVDHINRTTLDNRRHTLRVVTKSENARNLTLTDYPRIHVVIPTSWPGVTVVAIQAIVYEQFTGVRRVSCESLGKAIVVVRRYTDGDVPISQTGRSIIATLRGRFVYGPEGSRGQHKDGKVRVRKRWNMKTIMSLGR